MSELTSPRIVVVSGLPGAGKSTIGRSIAGRLKMPLLDKDDYLEQLFDREIVVSHQRRDELSRCADDLLIDELERHRSAVVVSFWRRVELSTTSGTPVERVASTLDLVEVWCDCRPEVALDRFFSRQRHPSHGDGDRDRSDTLQGFRQLAALGPLGVGRLVRADTNGVIDIDAVLRRIRTT